jgi:P27 family predicted phage terminase small subunit
MKRQPPDHLDPVAVGKWQEIVTLLQERGDDVDAGTLTAVACYAVAWSQWREATQKAQETGLIVRSPQGFPQENPFAVVARKAQTELRRWGAELKLSPKSRGRAKQPDAEESAVDRILRQLDEEPQEATP